MNAFTLSSLLVFLFNVTLGFFVYVKCKDKRLGLSWLSFTLLAAIWGLGGYLSSIADTKESAFFWWQFSYLGVILVPVAYFHFVYIYLELKGRVLLISSYVLGFCFVALNFSSRDLFLGDIRYVFNSFYWSDWLAKKALAYFVFYIYFYWFLLSRTFFLLVKSYKYVDANRRNQHKYFILASIMGWLGAECNFLPGFRIDIYPLPNFLIAFYPFIMSYAIIRHHLLDINIAIKKGLVYSILATVITVAYLIFVIAIGRLFQGLLGYQSFIVNLFAIFGIAILSNPLRNRIQRFLDRRFFKGTLESLSQERERLKENLFQTEKLAYVGNLASSVAHEIRNPLTAIKTFIEYFPQKSEDPEFKEKFQKFLPKEIERIERVVNQLLDLAKPRQSLFAPINIVNTIDTTLSLLENNLKLKAIEVKRDYQASDTLIQADEEQLKQVFLNLFLNAIQAMNNGGVLAVNVSIRVNSRSEKFAEISVKDTGVGISADNLQKLFTPFFTTKKEGVGLGLTVTQEIIKQHRGTIKVESKEGQGTKFMIELPIGNK